MITVTPPAKINLGLNVIRRRADGYHDIETVFYPVPIFDTITIRPIEGKEGTCTLVQDGTPIDGAQEDNLVVKAYRKLCHLTPLPAVEITLTKNIPMQAGMGGGSADCAYTLTALNKLFRIGCGIEKLEAIAAELGADCPFFIKSRPCYATGIGEIMEPIDLKLDDYWIAVVKPPVSVSTREAFAGIPAKEQEICCRDIVTKYKIEDWRGLLDNDFEQTIFPLHPELKEIKERLYGYGALYAAMSGSGSALFGIFREEPQGLDFEGCRTEIMRFGRLSEK